MSEETTLVEGSHGPVGIVGLGAMGSRMARRLLAAGLDVVATDVDPDAVERLAADGARVAASARDVADQAAVVLVSLPSPNAVEEVALGTTGLRGGAALRTYVDLSTCGVNTSREVARQLGSGIDCVDAPVSGGPGGAEAGTLTIMLAGEEAAIARVRPVLDHLGSNFIRVGDAPGQAQAMKLINNVLMAGALALTGEALSLGVSLGLDPAIALEVLAVSTGANHAAGTKFPQQVLTRRFAHGFRLDLLDKDVRLCLAAAEEQSVPMAVGSLVGKLLAQAVADAGQDADCTELVRMIERRAGVEIAAKD